MANGASDWKMPDTAPGTISKQAVVMIHGIGEQVPLETLRSFVETVYQRDVAPRENQRTMTNDPDLGDVNLVWAVPDDATGTAELRRISTPPDGNGLRTDFFEFYWADIMDGTPVEMVIGWVRGLLLRSPYAIPRHWRVWISYVALAVISILFVLFTLATLDPTATLLGWLIGPMRGLIVAGHGWIGWIAATLGTMLFATRFLSATPPSRVQISLPLALVLGGAVLALLPAPILGLDRLWSGAIAALMALALNGIVGPYAGDIVRYVRATPKTVSSRQKVRERGLKLLQDLHGVDPETGAPIYDRIVIVAHSLGTIIGYDLIQLLWEKEGPTHHQRPLGADAVQQAFRAADEFVLGSWVAPETGTPFAMAEFQRRQRAVSRAIAGERLRFRITDFVTLGAALTHADFLMADDGDALKRNFEERLFSSAPPRPDWPSVSMLYPERLEGEEKVYGPYAHFAAPFAAVCWTNIYDEHWLPLLGDIVSGPLAPLFGPGVDDRRVWIRRPGWLPPFNRLLTHTHYWNWHASYAAGVPDHIRYLREILWPRPSTTLPPEPPAS